MQFLLIPIFCVSWIVVGYFLLGFLEYLANRWGYHEPADGILVLFCLTWPLMFFPLLVWLWADFAPKRRIQRRIHTLKAFVSKFNITSPRKAMVTRGKAAYEARKPNKE